MLLVKPLTIGTLTIEQLKNGNFIITNNQQPPNRLILRCRSVRHGEDMIDKIQLAAPGELMEL